jgi:hypothetical protein
MRDFQWHRWFEPKFEVPANLQVHSRIKRQPGFCPFFTAYAAAPPYAINWGKIFGGRRLGELHSLQNNALHKPFDLFPSFF